MNNKKRSKICIEQIDSNKHVIILSIPNEAVPNHVYDNLNKDIVHQPDLSLTVGVDVVTFEELE